MYEYCNCATSCFLCSSSHSPSSFCSVSTCPNISRHSGRQAAVVFYCFIIICLFIVICYYRVRGVSHDSSPHISMPLWTLVSTHSRSTYITKMPLLESKASTKTACVSTAPVFNKNSGNPKKEDSGWWALVHHNKGVSGALV